MNVQPHLCFEGRCDEALEFYRKALGAEVQFLLRFNEMPGGCPPGSIAPGTENKVMHACVRIGDSTIMASDGRCTGKANFHGIALSITANSEAEADKLFGGLAEGGQVNMPLSKTFFSPKFGMLSDKFGVGWMISVAH